MPAPPLLSPTFPFRHRGFALAVQPSGQTPAFGFSIAHRGLVLHVSRPLYRTPTAADRAARRFIDDALGAYGVARARLAA